MPREIPLAADVAAQLLAAQRAVEQAQKRAKVEIARAEVALYDAQQALEAVLAPLVEAHGIGPADRLTVDGSTLRVMDEVA